MIIENEQEYRKYPAFNYSSLSYFDKNRIKYWRKYVLKEESGDEINHSMMVGMLTDVLLLNPETFDEKFNVVKCEPISGQWLLFVEELYKTTLKYVVDASLTKSMEFRLSETFEIFKKKYPDKFKGKNLSWIITNFVEPLKGEGSVSPEDYYNSCLESFDKIPIDQNLLAKVSKIVDNVKFGKYTKEMFRRREGVEMKYQIGVVAQCELGVEIKGLFDILEINHNTKTVKGTDLKAMWDVESFDYSFKKNKYYLQASMYHELITQYIIDAGLEGYTPDETFTFLVVDTTMQFIPHYWEVSKETIEKGSTRRGSQRCLHV